MNAMYMYTTLNDERNKDERHKKKRVIDNHIIDYKIHFVSFFTAFPDFVKALIEDFFIYTYFKF